MKYIHIHGSTPLPDISSLAPFKAVLSVEKAVTAQRQAEISAWLVQMGCRYAMIHGEGCDAWCASIRDANLHLFDLNTMTPRNFVMTTAHRQDSLRGVFWYAKKVATHPDVEFQECVVVHLSGGDRSAQYLAAFERA